MFKKLKDCNIHNSSLGPLNKEYDLNKVLDGLGKNLGVKRKYLGFRPPAQYVFVAQHAGINHTNARISNDNAADENGNNGSARKKAKLNGNPNLD
jgi:hypothetical protein